MKDNREKTGNLESQIDTERILNHIKYTRHWLDKADEDYQNKRFGNGGMILGLARAELTAAWEEALQLKTQIFRNVPRKAKGMANWKNASGAGLMAAGFIIAFMVVQAGNTSLFKPQNNIAGDSRMVIVTEEPQQPVAAVPEAAPAASPAEPQAVPAETQAVEKPAAASKHSFVRHSSNTKTETAAPAQKEAPAPIVVLVSPQEKVPEHLIFREPEKAPEPKPAKPKPHLDGIDLFKTANDAINK